MEVLVEDISLWDPMEDPQLAAEYLDFEYLRNDWVNADGDKLIQKNKTSDKDEQNFLLDDFEFSNWMESKFDFAEENNNELTSIEELESFLLSEPLDDDENRIQIWPDTEQNLNVNKITNLEVEETLDEPNPKLDLSSDDSESDQSQITIEDNSQDSSAPKRRRKPYDRPNNDKSWDNRKSRKRSQNRNAATRYRQKKKEEAEAVAAEEARLQVVNDELNKKVEDLSRDIKCLKDLLRELVQNKK